MNKISLIVLIGSIFSLNSYGYNRNYVPYGNGIIVKTRDGSSVYIPRQNTTNQQKPLQGQGVTFYSTVKVTEEQVADPDDTTGKKTKLVKKYTAWVRGCSEVVLQEKKDQNAKTGDRIELKFDHAGSCSVMDWRKN